MNFAGNFKKIADVNIEMLRNIVVQLTPEHWSIDSSRQKRYEAHRDTQMIGLVFDKDFRHSKPTKQEPYELFAPALRQIFTAVANFYEAPAEEAALWRGYGKGYFVRAILVLLKPGGEISAHQDKVFSLSHSHRIHIPVVTNDKVTFTVGSETINMEEGEVVEINNRRMHQVKNEGTDGRVHLILDWVIPGETCCCSGKVHPGLPCSPEECEQTDHMKIECHCFPEEEYGGDHEFQ